MYAFNSRNEQVSSSSADVKPTNPFVFGEAATKSAPADAKPPNEYNRSESPKFPRIDKPKVIPKFLKVEESRSLSSHSSEMKYAFFLLRFGEQTRNRFPIVFFCVGRFQRS